VVPLRPCHVKGLQHPRLLVASHGGDASVARTRMLSELAASFHLFAFISLIP
jgi:hypothetical protein